MPDENSSEAVKQEAKDHNSKAEAVPLPDTPHCPKAQQVSGQDVQREVQEIQDSLKRGELLMIRLTAAIAFFALCAVIVGVLQWSAMKGQLDEMKSGGKDTQRLAVAAGKQADAAKTTADLNKRTLAATSAARCSPAVMNRVIGIQHMYLIVACEAGKVDATLRRGEFKITVRDLRTGKAVGREQTVTLDQQVIRPGGSSFPQTNFDVAALSEREFYSLRQEVIVRGFVEYDDGFDRIISLKFCQTILPYRSSNGQYNGMTTSFCGPATEDVLRTYREADKKPN